MQNKGLTLEAEPTLCGKYGFLCLEVLDFFTQNLAQ